MSNWPYITVGGEYNSSIIIRGNVKALPADAQGIIRQYFNRWSVIHDPTTFPDLLENLRGLTTKIHVDDAAVDRYNKYIDIHTLILSSDTLSTVIGTNESKPTSIVVSHKAERTTPRIGAVVRAFFDQKNSLKDPWRIWEFSEAARDADGLLKFDKSFAKLFAKQARSTVVFMASKYFKYHIEIGFHPKILNADCFRILEPHIESWGFRERNGESAARWLLSSPVVLGTLVTALISAGCSVKLYSDAWNNVVHAYLLAGKNAPAPPLALIDRLPIDNDKYSKKSSQSLPSIAKSAGTVVETVTRYSKSYSKPCMTDESNTFVIDKLIGDKELEKSIIANLYPFQRTGVRHLVHTGKAMLADDMGLGKTVQAIAAMRILALRNKANRALVICPASLKYQWKNEIEHFTELSPIIVEGDRDARVDFYKRLAQYRYELEKFPIEKLPQIVIMNYELSFRDEKWLQEIRPDVIILDEAQRIKNWQSKTHQAVVGLKAKYRFVLTGTPLENEFMELFNVLQFVDPEVLGTNPIEARKRYTIYDRFGGVSGYQNLREASKRISGVSLRRTREETLAELPDLIESYYWLELDAEQRKIYRDIDDRARGFLSADEWDKVAYDSAMTMVQRLREVCDTPEMLFPEHKASVKLAELKVILEEQVLTLGRSAIVFTQWTRMAEILEREFAAWKISYRYMHGGVPARDRARLCEEFNRGDAQVFLSTDAGATGINLQTASLVINFDLPFNPAIVEQRIARAHRHGQKSSVNAIHLVVRGTIEENLIRILKRRRELFNDVFSEVGDGTTPLTASGKSRSFLIELLGQKVPVL